MVKCKNCKYLNTVKDDSTDEPFNWCICTDDNPYKDIERDCKHYALMTNADRIRNMTDEELAETVMCPCNIIGSNETCFYKRDCKECVLAWLQKESEEQ